VTGTVGLDLPTMNPLPWAATGVLATDNGPAATGTHCAYISGTLNAYNGTGPYPAAWLAFELVPGGSANGFAGTDPTINATVSGIRLDYKADAAGTVATSCVVQYQVMLVSTDAGAGNTDYYQFTFTPADTNWHTLDIYFPASAPYLNHAINTFGQAGFGTPYAFSSTPKIGAVLIRPVIPGSGTANYGIKVDNISFNAPVAPQPAAIDDGNGNLLTDFEPFNNNNTGLGGAYPGFTYGFIQQDYGVFNTTIGGAGNCCGNALNFGNGTNLSTLNVDGAFDASQNLLSAVDGASAGTNVSWW
jgi:hypothetical protein